MKRALYAIPCVDGRRIRVTASLVGGDPPGVEIDAAVLDGERVALEGEQLMRATEFARKILLGD